MATGNDELWLVLAVLATIGGFYILSAVGCATIVFLRLRKLDSGSASLLASGIGPLFLVALAAVIVMHDTPPDSGAVTAVIIVTFIVGVMIGWPASFLTIRALRNRVEQAGVNASEIFR